jgi:hypothetical protein
MYNLGIRGGLVNRNGGSTRDKQWIENYTPSIPVLMAYFGNIWALGDL